MRMTAKRKEMGEDAWALYQAERKRNKSRNYVKNNVDKVVKARQKKKRLLVEYKGGQCEICEFKSEYMDVYDFHHVNPDEKEFGLAGEGKNFSLEKCKKEVDKCQLLCKNCHAITHAKLAIEKRKT